MDYSANEALPAVVNNIPYPVTVCVVAEASIVGGYLSPVSVVECRFQYPIESDRMLTPSLDSENPGILFQTLHSREFVGQPLPCVRERCFPQCECIAKSRYLTRSETMVNRWLAALGASFSEQ
jgi:hypothetical protein